MNMQLPLTDNTIRAAIARRATSGGEHDLRERVLAAAAAVPQRRGWRVRVEQALTLPERMPARTLALAVVLLLATALGVALVGSLVDRMTPAPLGALAYISAGDLYVAGPAGESQRLVWDSPEEDFLSDPMRVDAETILVNVRRAEDGEYLVYLVDIATTSAPRVVDYGSELLALSPDHRRIATARAIAGAASRLQIVDLATGSIVDIAGVESVQPLSWSPDDRWLVGEGSRVGIGNFIYQVDLQKAGGDRLTDLATGLCCNLNGPRPVLSPDGSRVVFVNHHQADQGDFCDFRCGTLWSLDPVTGARQQLTATEGSEVGPAFSPDGAWIAFMEWAGTGYDVAVIRADGTGRRKLTETGDAYAPNGNSRPYRYIYWDLDGAGLTFMKGDTGLGHELWHVALDGQIEQRIGSFVVSEFSR